ncbi:hypothetical protein C8R43DRAFT_452516 [Mycena crocata]|nr:hypothetical protein C8R43DRAFT_452516 [Mycena crocata]
MHYLSIAAAPASIVSYYLLIGCARAVLSRISRPHSLVSVSRSHPYLLVSAYHRPHSIYLPQSTLHSVIRSAIYSFVYRTRSIYSLPSTLYLLTV